MMFKNFLFFSRSDKIGILSLSAITILILLINSILLHIRHIKYDEENYFADSNYVDTVFFRKDNLVYDTGTQHMVNKEQRQTFVIRSDTLVRGKQNYGRREKVYAVKKQHEMPVIELNTADSLQLVSLPGIGPYYASRIMKYRSMLGGFVSKKQLLEVYGFNPETYNLVKDRVTVDTSMIVKIDINNATFKEVLKHPYFDYKTTLRVVRCRDKMHFTSIEDFSSRTDIYGADTMRYILIR